MINATSIATLKAVSRAPEGLLATLALPPSRGDTKPVSDADPILIAPKAQDARAADDDLTAKAETRADSPVDRPSSQRLASDLWRFRQDPETLRLFTEVVHPVTRLAMYRVPPIEISETAEAEGRQIARSESFLGSAYSERV